MNLGSRHAGIYTGMKKADERGCDCETHLLRRRFVCLIDGRGAGRSEKEYAWIGGIIERNVSWTDGGILMRSGAIM